jgi:hypothetical protein
MLKRISLILLLLMCGCAGRKPIRGVGMIIPHDCIIGDAVLNDCAPGTDPIACHRIKLNYRHGCEVMTLTKEDK